MAQRRTSRDHDLAGMITELFQQGSGRSHAQQFTERVLDLAVSATRWMVQKRGYYFDSLGLSIRDIATDAVAELLSGTGKGEEPPVIRYLARSADPVADPVSAEAHLRVLVVRIIDQNITRILAEYDPVYAKSLRMLRIHVRKCEDISVKQGISGRWYYRDSEEGARFHLPALDADALKTRVHVRCGDGNPSVVVLEACLDYLVTQDEYRKAVHEADVMRLTLDLLGLELHALAGEAEEGSNDHDFKLLLDTVETALAETRQWAVGEYVKKGKLTLPELEAMIGAVRVYVLEAVEGMPESHFSYLRKHLPGLTYERFRTDYRNILQYILKRFFASARGLLLSLEGGGEGFPAGIDGTMKERKRGGQ